MPSKEEVQESAQRHGKLSIPLPFEDALRAVLRVKPDGKQEPSKPRKAPKAAPRPTRRHGTAS